MPMMDPQTAYERVKAMYEKGRFRSALTNVEAMLRQMPGHIPLLGLQVSCLLRLDRAAEAARVTRRALRHVSVPAQRTMLAVQLVEAHSQLNEFDDAIELVRAEHQARPNDDRLTSAYAHILFLAGRKTEALDLVLDATRRSEPSVDLASAFGEAALRTDHAQEAIDYALRAIAAQPEAPPRNRCRAHTQLGHLLDRAKRYDEAFEHYRLANSLVPAEYHDEVNRQRLDALIEIYDPARFENAPRPAPHGPRPVFIVGMPRSGTTLTEQIIDAHPRAFGAGELGAINELVQETLATGDNLDALRPDRIDPARLNEAAESYRRETLAIATKAGHPDAALIVDKAPTNFWYIGFIAQAFPDARIIHCRRDPRDTCLSCYFQALNAAHAYAFDLRHCGQFYRVYLGMMEHARRLAADPRVGLSMLEIGYEDTVADQEAQTRRILDFIGLPFDDACLKFNETGRIARTLSNDQVRQPIYKSSTRRYERYARHLAPLLEGLGDAVPQD